jgi:hypothetical protein
LLDIRRGHPGASVPLILRALILNGRLAKRAVSATTVTRLSMLSVRLRATCVIHAPYACRTTPPICTRRVWRSITNSTR